MTCRFSDDGAHHYERVTAKQVKKWGSTRRSRNGSMGVVIQFVVLCHVCMQPAIVKLRTGGLLGNHASIKEVFT